MLEACLSCLHGHTVLAVKSHISPLVSVGEHRCSQNKLRLPATLLVQLLHTISTLYHASRSTCCPASGHYASLVHLCNIELAETISMIQPWFGCDCLCLMLESSLLNARSMPELLAWPYSAIHVVCDASVTLTKSICVHRVPGDCISVDTALPSLKLWIYHLHSLTSNVD